MKRTIIYQHEFVKFVTAIIFAVGFLPFGSFSQKYDVFHVEPNPDALVSITPAFLDNPQPGDTICLIAGDYYQLFVFDVHGSDEYPIVIRNCGGRVMIQNNVNYGIAFHNCSHIRLLGVGSPDHEYGIAITGTGGNGISVDKKSSNIEIAFVEVGNTGMSGMMFKSDPTCTDFSVVRDSFALQEVNIYSNYIHNTGNEGIYIGSSYYNGFPMNCDGFDTIVLPHEVIGVNIFNNIFEQTGRNSIQVSSAPERCFIHNNYISRDSEKAIFQHMNGIQVGGGSCCDVFNNMIFDGKGSGIHYFGKGPARLFNNLIVNSGRTHYPELPYNEHPVHGIFIKYIYSDNQYPIHVLHNTIVNPKTNGVVFNNEETDNSRIQNNIVINPGGFDFVPDKAFINPIPEEIPLIVSHNFFDNDSSNVKFNSACSHDYSPSPFSPVINAGLCLDETGISFDIMNAPRPFGAAPDIGAFEYQSLVPLTPGENYHIIVYPNPANNEIRFRYEKQINKIHRIDLYDFLGRKIMSIDDETICPNIVIPINHMPSGFYHMVIMSGETRVKTSFIKL
jgi:hypothetical protein